MSASEDDLKFLALLTHRGYLEAFQAKALIPALQSGAELDELLHKRMDWEPEKVSRLRRSRAGEKPEIPGYEMMGRVGSGGTADVFRARDTKSGKAVALKVLHHRCTRDPDQRKQFIEEAKLLQKFDHPGLVKGYGVARSGETYFARLDYIDGKTLLEYLDEGQPFEEAVALRVVLEVGEVLKYMSEQGYVHRDIKPGNIMLTSSAQVKLIDLGFCAAKGTCSKEDTTAGTTAYISPDEAMGGAAADERSDIYSLGVTLFHLVVGKLPFESSDDEELLRMQVMESLKSPELKGRKLSPHLQYFIEKMMSKEADLRFQSWDEFLGDVREQIDGRKDLDFREQTRTSRSKLMRRSPRTRRR